MKSISLGDIVTLVHSDAEFRITVIDESREPTLITVVETTNMLNTHQVRPEDATFVRSAFTDAFNKNWCGREDATVSLTNAQLASAPLTVQTDREFVDKECSACLYEADGLCVFNPPVIAFGNVTTFPVALRACAKWVAK